METTGLSPCTLVFFLGAALGFFGVLISIIVGLWYLGVVQNRKTREKQ